ncbi:hypothetical protein [uncultured Aquimarina sp.]|uniref:hypothetical protein n=1 Tax=uncultured Aquimarina sp. TaxID=575652 RepID=UPI0026334CC8|nr:hypothetical protein [uncultured Aquimarina sp.]
MKQIILITTICIITFIGSIYLQAFFNPFNPYTSVINHSSFKGELMNLELVKNVTNTFADSFKIDTQSFIKDKRSIKNIWLLIVLGIALLTILIRISIYPKIESLAPSNN